MKNLYTKITSLRVTEKITALILLILLIFCAVSLVVAGTYVLPQADDYGFSAQTYQVYKETGSITQTLIAAFDVAKHTYYTWQGSYSACFFMALQPGIFGLEFYKLVAPFLLGTLALSTFMFFSALRRTFFKSFSKTGMFILTATALLLQIFYVPYPDQSFYWYNGSIYYTFYYSLSLIFYTITIYSIHAKFNILSYISLAILSIVIGGGPFSMCLVIFLFNAVLIFVAYLKKYKGRHLIAFSTIILFIGFMFNALAPGNEYRQAVFNGQPGALKSIYLSLLSGLNFIVRWSNLGVILAILLISPILYRLAKNTPFSFRFPLIAIGFTFCVFSSIFCPPIFAMNHTGPGRLINIAYFVYILMLMFWVYYLCGYAQNHIEKIDVAANVAKKLFKKYSALLCAFCIVFYGAIFTVGIYFENSPYQATKIVLNGEAQAFYNELIQRVEVYENPDIKDVVIPALETTPFPIFHNDLSDDYTYFANINIASYYGKDSVRVEFPADYLG